MKQNVRVHMRYASGLLVAVGVLALVLVGQGAEPQYVKKDSRVATVTATLKAADLPALDGKWYLCGPFDNTDNRGFEAAYPPEKEFDLSKSYSGKDGATVKWVEAKDFTTGTVYNLKKSRRTDFCVVYLATEFESKQACKLPLSLGSDDGLVVWLNGERLLAEDTVRGAAPDQNEVVLPVKEGKNRLLIKVTNIQGEWSVYAAPDLPATFPAAVREQLAREFPRQKGSEKPPATGAEAKYYKISTLPVPKDCVLEVGGLAMRPDGKLYACTRRGEIWLVSNPGADDPEKTRFKLVASGLHEPLGLCLDGKDLYVTQRAELTRLRDTDGDDVFDEFNTVCDKWGVSGDYHEFAFGGVRDKDGNFFVTLNVGFGGGHQAKCPWRGWCVKITPKGDLIPWATGLRSPNGVRFSPEGDLFYCDNQGEWVATNKMHHIKEGEFYGHQAGLRWVSKSPFAKTLLDKYPQGMLNDGGKGKERDGMPDFTPPCIWFPYGRMGQSTTEPIWDTTGGKFGPFQGQCFVGDQNKSNLMRVVLEKVNGRYQGACFPFRNGFECGTNRLEWGADGNLYVGMTNRGWGSVGGKPYGLQRLTWTGEVPMEILSMKLTKTGFDLTFTKPLDPEAASKVAAYSLQSFTYNYWSTYGSPEVGHRAEPVKEVKLSADKKTVSLTVENFKKGRVYEVNLSGIKSATGDPVLHPQGWYTLNDVPQ